MKIENVDDNTIYTTTGIEDDNENETFTDPFDPEKISISSKLVSMETCLRRIEQKTIILNPDFQRKEVWKEDKKSQLIESLMLKIPLPMFYVSADERSNYTVVDGLQRLSTIRSFVLGDEYLKNKKEVDKGNGFKLEKLEFWKNYEGKTFKELPIHIKNSILEAEFTFTVIDPGTPEEVRRNIFKRLNTGGEPLSSQEIRNALYIGQSTVLLNELAENIHFKKATGNSIKDLRMADKELILRFIAFLVRDYSSYTKTIRVDTFLSDTMIIVNAIPSFNTREFNKLIHTGKERVKEKDIIIKSIDEIKVYFEKGMIRAEKIFGKHTFRKSYGENHRNPINKSLFEMWGGLLSKLSEDAYAQLLKNKSAFIKDYNKIIEEQLFQIAISRDSMKHGSVKFRFDIISELINKYTND
jgi:uncharacterized protein with ParB-like and HNH nuclease domain